MRTMFNVISDKKRVHRRFFTTNKVVKEPTGTGNYGYGGAWKQPFRDDEGEFMGCLNLGVLKKLE